MSLGPCGPHWADSQKVLPEVGPGIITGAVSGRTTWRKSVRLGLFARQHSHSRPLSLGSEASSIVALLIDKCELFSKLNSFCVMQSRVSAVNCFSPFLCFLSRIAHLGDATGKLNTNHKPSASRDISHLFFSFALPLPYFLFLCIHARH